MLYSLYLVNRITANRDEFGMNLEAVGGFFWTFLISRNMNKLHQAGPTGLTYERGIHDTRLRYYQFLIDRAG
jgi:hypothetical protein